MPILNPRITDLCARTNQASYPKALTPPWFVAHLHLAYLTQAIASLLFLLAMNLQDYQRLVCSADTVC